MTCDQKLKKAKEQTQQDKFRSSTQRIELAKHLNISIFKLDQILSFNRGYDFRFTKVDKKWKKKFRKLSEKLSVKRIIDGKNNTLKNYDTADS